MQGFVNTLADLQGMLAAVKRINGVVGRAQIDEWLAHGLEREARGELQNSDECASSVDTGVVGPSLNGTAAHSLNYGSKKSVCELAWSGDVVLESKFVYPYKLALSILMVIEASLLRCYACRNPQPTVSSTCSVDVRSTLAHIGHCILTHHFLPYFYYLSGLQMYFLHILYDARHLSSKESTCI